ncbi:UvrD-helicase domain-containing protein [Sphingomonas jatrophae]|uniref:Superfamily I DNA or RNA helicase n=1 Tax=Sphingomonas jatrophae TaxID=1166337 RepID=A0A1I6M0L5_9SPHN|nr:ATP-dependent helicase [Sphingomonas jatrophae]SFS09168.1 Superfamily I DNA or RNA helicase [Sphingomonas jatrophae]
MTVLLSDEQAGIVALPLGPLAVSACAGSGKTRTAVHRLAAMRRLYEGRGIVALLSFSNVAVDTFSKEYGTLLRDMPVIGRSATVEIDTMDGFITTNILRPHGHRVMKCPRAPFLVDGTEPFLNSFTVWDGSRPRPTTEIDFACDGANFKFLIGKNKAELPANWAAPAVASLGKTGAYTHNAGRYWVLRVLREKPFVLRALARRYPHILVDEAQDIGPEHQAVLELLIEAGSQLSLIGDPHQGIFDFARAKGAFLKAYSDRADIAARSLTVNYRSLPGIVSVANRLIGARDTAARVTTTERPSAFYMPYKAASRDAALDSFRSLLVAAGVDPAKGVVLCRSNDLTAEWRGEMYAQGVGVVRCLAEAAISRERRDFLRAYQQTCLGLMGLLAPKHGSLAIDLARPADETMRLLRQRIWAFVRDPVSGLPAATLVADTGWHSALKARVTGLIAVLGAEFGLQAAENLGQRLAKKQLANAPLLAAPILTAAAEPSFRTSTVHRVKGESLDAVLYVAKKSHVRALLDGTDTEDGRIGYVALTRAKDLFVLAVPDTALHAFEPELQASGLVRA